MDRVKVAHELVTSVNLPADGIFATRSPREFSISPWQLKVNLTDQNGEAELSSARTIERVQPTAPAHACVLSSNAEEHEESWARSAPTAC
jgi:hypothetical protein